MKRLIKALKKAADNIARFHTAQIPEEWFIEVDEGVTAGQIVVHLIVLDVTYRWKGSLSINHTHDSYTC